MSSEVRYPIPGGEPSWIERRMVASGFGGVAYCRICAHWVPLRVEGSNLRETFKCRRCGSTNRQRQLAYVACRAVEVASLRALARLADLVVYNLETSGPVHAVLSQGGHYLCSEYFGPDHRSGDVVGGVQHQDLMALSFPSESIDLVLSGDVLEHVPDAYQAQREIRRVLRPGGRHVFTVPFYQTEFLDEQRARHDAAGNLVLEMPPIYHDDPLRPEGILVYRIFGLEMLVRLRQIGFRTNLYHLRRPLEGIWGSNAIVFEAVKTE